VNICTEHLERHNNDPDFLNRIISIDETWIKSYDPKGAARAREWRYSEDEL